MALHWFLHWFDRTSGVRQSVGLHSRGVADRKLIEEHFLHGSGVDSEFIKEAQRLAGGWRLPAGDIELEADDPMAAITETSCPECGQRHVLFLADGNSFEADVDYEFTCPSRCRVLRFTTSKKAVAARVAGRPRGSVVATRIDVENGE
jgi:hypothetical protein